MAKRKDLDLTTFDGRMLNGLNFCRRVYAFCEQIRSAPDGTKRLRLRPSKNEKRLIEELIPLARYVQARYREGRSIKVRWFAGSQPYDGKLLSAGAIVDRGYAPKETFVEITSSVHASDHLLRELIDKGGPAFGVKGIVRDKKTRVIKSEPYVVVGGEREADLAEQIIARIKDKSAKGYPDNTVLIVRCVPNGVILEDEWNAAMQKVAQAEAHHGFSEVFLTETSIANFSAFLYPNPKREGANGHAA